MKSRRSISPANTQLKSDEKSPNINGNNPQTCQISSKDDDSSRSSNTSQNVAGKSNTGQKEEASTMTELQEILNIMEDIPKVLKHEPRLISVIQSVLEIAKTKSSDVSFAILMFFLRNFESIPENCLTNFKKTLEDTLLPNELWRHLIDFDDLDYRESIGHGSFSVVYRAHLVQNGKRKTVAVKESSDPSFNKMFTEEAKMLLEFNHDNVLKIVGICMTNGIKLVLEYMECGILMEYLQEEEEENRKILLKVIYQVANGLAYIAEKKYIHRDLHVNNILIDKDGNSKISDFGLCKYLGNAAKEYIDKKSRQSKSPANTQLNGEEKSPNTNENHLQTRQISSKNDDSPSSSNTSQNVAGKCNNGQKEGANTMTDLQAILKIMEDIPKVLKNQPGLISVFHSVLEIGKSKSSDVSFEILMYFLRKFENIPENCLTNFKKILEDIFLPNELWRHIIDFDDLDYRDIIGHGYFSVVYQALLVQNGKIKTVAVKESTNPSFNKMFMEEANILLEFNHENILKIVGICMTKEIKLVLEYMECGALMRYLQKKTEGENHKILLKVIYQVANGLEYIAEKKYIHRDLHVNNILVDKDGNCKICDFGLCKYLGNSATVYIEKNIKAGGFWNAPEVLSKSEYSYKSDVFSLSILCFQILGCVPRNWLQSVIFKQMLESRNFSTWEAIKHHCPEQLFNVIRSGISQNPHDRPDAIIFKNVVKKYVN